MFGGRLLRGVAVSVSAGGVLLGLLAAGPGAAPAASVSVPNVTGNWAGYVTDPGTGVTNVAGSWTVPNAGTLPPGSSSTWVGIGGYSSSDLIQTGTLEQSSPYSQLISGGAYSAWYELLPAFPVTIPDPVHPGDHMQASIVSGGGTSWTINLADTTAGWSFTKAVTYASSESSAEWIHESPTLEVSPVPVGVIVPMGNAGTVHFDLGSAVIGGATKSLAGAGAFPVVALPVESATSALDSDGDGFNVCTYALTCPAPAS